MPEGALAEGGSAQLIDVVANVRESIVSIVVGVTRNQCFSTLQSESLGGRELGRQERFKSLTVNNAGQQAACADHGKSHVMTRRCRAFADDGTELTHLKHRRSKIVKRCCLVKCVQGGCT